MYVHGCMCTRVTVHFCACGDERLHQVSSSTSAYLIFWNRVSHWTQSLLIWLHWLANKTPGSSCLHLPSLETTDSYFCAWLFYVGPGDWISSPHACVSSALPTYLSFHHFLTTLFATMRKSRSTRFFFLLFVVLGMKLRALHMLEKHSTTELYSHVYLFLFIFLDPIKLVLLLEPSRQWVSNCGVSLHRM